MLLVWGRGCGQAQLHPADVDKFGKGQCSCSWEVFLLPSYLRVQAVERMVVSANTALPSPCCQITDQGCVPQCVLTLLLLLPGSNASPGTPPQQGPIWQRKHLPQVSPSFPGPSQSQWPWDAFPLLTQLQSTDQECLGSKPGTGTGVATTLLGKEGWEKGKGYEGDPVARKLTLPGPRRGRHLLQM